MGYKAEPPPLANEAPADNRGSMPSRPDGNETPTASSVVREFSGARAPGERPGPADSADGSGDCAHRGLLTVIGRPAEKNSDKKRPPHGPVAI